MKRRVRKKHRSRDAHNRPVGATGEQGEVEMKKKVKSTDGLMELWKVLKKGQTARLKQNFRKLAQLWYVEQAGRSSLAKRSGHCKPRRPGLTN